MSGFLETERTAELGVALAQLARFIQHTLAALPSELADDLKATTIGEFLEHDANAQQQRKVSNG